MTFAQTIRAAREERGLSREQVARRIGCSAGHLLSIEHGHKPPPGDTSLVMLANVLRLDATTLVREALCERTFIRVECAGVPQRELATEILLAVARADAAGLRVLRDAVAKAVTP